MIRSLRNALLFTPLLAMLVACGSGSSGPPPNLAAARQSMPLVQYSEDRGTGLPPPGFLEIDQPKDFAADATYFVAIIDAQDAIQQYYQTELPKTGWTTDDPPVLSQDDQLASYCQTPTITCKSYTKDKVRAIIVTVMTLGFSSAAREGSTYHLHVEEQ